MSRPDVKGNEAAGALERLMHHEPVDGYPEGTYTASDLVDDKITILDALDRLDNLEESNSD